MVDRTSITRKPGECAKTHYDLVVIGGGIHGATLLLEAALRGLKVLLLEAGDFGGGVSAQSSRILHGGLRYLQQVDLKRFKESVAERRWFCEHFAEHVRPLDCMMPLYNRGMKRSSMMGVALKLNDHLSRKKNEGVAERCHLGRSRILSNEEVIERYAGVRQEGLKRGALWQDAIMTNPARVQMEMLRWAISLGGKAINYCKVDGFKSVDGRIEKVMATDQIHSERHAFDCDEVADCTLGGAAKMCELAGIDGFEVPYCSAFNLLIDREPMFEDAVAVQPKKAGGRMYFLVPMGEQILAGTTHLPMVAGEALQETVERSVGEMLADLNDAMPNITGGAFEHGDVARVMHGKLLAAKRGGAETSERPLIVKHENSEAAQNFTTCVGIKYTTARATAEKALAVIYGEYVDVSEDLIYEKPVAAFDVDLKDPDAFLAMDDEAAKKFLQQMRDEEAVVRVDDLVCRRTDWGMSKMADKVRERWEKLMGKDDVKVNAGGDV
ncbi:FAD-dependent oxidoreductase [Poriferisphaera sp. WC338]|uniref:FAD-dependent oxidoreductase n=1 Tax=Poriferisphaera sp. WC338 TaxID=3425129 RepID=UPI003D814AA6